MDGVGIVVTQLVDYPGNAVVVFVGERGADNVLESVAVLGQLTVIQEEFVVGAGVGEKVDNLAQRQEMHATGWIPVRGRGRPR